MLVWLSQTPQPDLAADAPAVAQWHAQGNPFVVCRQRGEGDRLSLGFCLAASGLRPRRIAAYSRSEMIVRAARPPSLAEVAKAHPETLGHLSAAAANAGLDVRVFGSWMWQTLSGVSHVAADSDLDVLIDVSAAAGADRTAAFLQTASADSPFRVDGEFSISGKGEVHWREYLNGTAELLLKSIVAARMIRRDDLWK
jgi:phosphoribosyl-dephospho-CoA transferase